MHLYLLNSWSLTPACYAQSPSPQNWENKTSAAMQKHEGVLFLAGARAPPPQWSGAEQEPGAQIYSSIYKFRTETGSWQGLIGCRGFLVFTDWPVIIPEAPEAWLRDYFWPSAPLWACHGSGEVVTKAFLTPKLFEMGGRSQELPLSPLYYF